MAAKTVTLIILALTSPIYSAPSYGTTSSGSSSGGYSSGGSSGGYSSGGSSGGYSSDKSSGGYSSGSSTVGYSSDKSYGGYSSDKSYGGYSSGSSTAGYSSGGSSGGYSSGGSSGGYSSGGSSGGYSSGGSSGGYSSGGSSGGYSSGGSSGDYTSGGSSGGYSSGGSSGGYSAGNYASYGYVCDKCKFDHGVGYMSFPEDCSLFIQCQQNKQGKPEIAAIKACPVGLYWDQSILTCNYPDQVNCENKVCKGQKQDQPSFTSCRRYWDCSGNYPYEKCCPQGQGFNKATYRCQPDSYCTDSCNEVAKPYDCDLRPDPHDKNSYLQEVDGYWISRPCAPGTAFDEDECVCGYFDNSYPGCNPELYYLVDSDEDVDKAGTKLDNYGVEVRNGEAYFNGYSKFLINRFSNAWWGSTVFIYLGFTLKSTPGVYGETCVLTNGDCGDTASVAVTATKDGVKFFAKTEYSPETSFVVPYQGDPTKYTQHVVYKLQYGLFKGNVTDNTREQYVAGDLESRHCGLVVGSGTDCQNLEGEIDYLAIYFCDPYSSY